MLHFLLHLFAIVGIWQKSVRNTRESLRLEGLLETKDLELVEKFVIFQLLYTVPNTNNKVRIYMYVCMYIHMYI